MENLPKLQRSTNCTHTIMQYMHDLYFISTNSVSTSKKKKKHHRPQLLPNPTANIYEYLPALKSFRTTASWGWTSTECRDVVPKRFIRELATNTPDSGRFGAHAGFRKWGSAPTLSRTRKCTQPQERKKARRGGDEAGGDTVELEEEFEEASKGRKVKLPYMRASSMALEWLRMLKRATFARLVLSMSLNVWELRGNIRK